MFKRLHHLVPPCPSARRLKSNTGLYNLRADQTVIPPPLLPLLQKLKEVYAAQGAKAALVCLYNIVSKDNDVDYVPQSFSSIGLAKTGETT